MQKRPPKTIKEKKFVKEYIKTGNATEAAARVYDVINRESAGAIGGENLRKLTIVEIMEQNGLTDEKITKTLNDGMDATEIDITGKEVPVWTARLKATELASKIKGHLKDKLDHGGKVDIKVTVEDVTDKPKDNSST